MARSDALVNQDEWIADFYLTTTESKGQSFAKRVKERIKDWRAEAAEGVTQTPIDRLKAACEPLERDLADLGPDPDPERLAAATAQIRDALGYGPASRCTLEGGVSFVGSTSDAESFVVVDAQPPESIEALGEARLAAPLILDGKELPDATLADALKAIILSPATPDLMVVIAGEWIALTTRDTWPQRRYFAGSILVVAQRHDFKVAGEGPEFAVCFARESVGTDAQGESWWSATRAEAHHHTSAVSDDLRDAVRESVEILGNDVLARRAARGLTDPVDGQELARQSLRYLYRILFVLFAEADPELRILPVGTPEYDAGYGLTRIAHVVLQQQADTRESTGTHLYRSLKVLFDLINDGHTPTTPAETPTTPAEPNTPAEPATPAETPTPGPGGLNPGLTFRNLSADLFRPDRSALIDEVGLSNAALGRVLTSLLLTREASGRERGFISYASLGVNQLGEVYESLMSYTGSVAHTELVELADPADPTRGRWVVERTWAAAQDFPAAWFVHQREPQPGGGWVDRPKVYRPGSFVFRQSSRDRERSASYYTPEVLTRFTVAQAIEELREAGTLTAAADVLAMRVCEPALGSGAFAVEAVRQLADLYVTLRQRELGETIPAEDYAAELQKIKARIALHQVYGVDLNAQAVELAEISLWLDTMTADLKAPWYGLHLRRGNSLIGAACATVPVSATRSRAWLSAIPTRQRVGAEEVAGLFTFLLPSNTWGAQADTKGVTDLAADDIRALKAWRSTVRRALPKSLPVAVDGTRQAVPSEQLLQGLSWRAATLWRFALARLRVAEAQVGRDIAIWGQPPVGEAREAVTRDQIEAELFGDPDSPYRRLRLVMDAWCALTFWPLDAAERTVNGEVVDPPTPEQWFAALAGLLGLELRGSGKRRKSAPAEGQMALTDMAWDDLAVAEEIDRTIHRARRVGDVVADHPWLAVCQRVAAQQGFFHWDLDFAPVFADPQAPGFDLQVGNPPWVRPDTNIDELYAESDPWFALAKKPTQEQVRARREQVGRSPRARSVILAGAGEVAATAAVLRSRPAYPHLEGRPNLYRAFMERTWTHAAARGAIGLVHPDTHLTDAKAARLREAAYRRLRRHWVFVNELQLFPIDHHVLYSVAIYGSRREARRFLHAAGLYHPRTASESLVHDGTGPQPGAKTADNSWDLSAHAARILTVTPEVLRTWRDLVDDPGTPAFAARMVYTLNRDQQDVLTRLAEAPRLGDLDLYSSLGWDEAAARKKGFFEHGWGVPASCADAIYQGVHLGVANPLFKQPNPTLKNNQDWTEIDLEAAGPDFVPATAYRPNATSAEGADYAASYTHWDIGDERVPARDCYRVAWRAMAAGTGVRTLYPALIPPGCAHVHTVHSFATSDLRETALAGATLSSLLTDFQLRSSVASAITIKLAASFPRVPSDHPLAPALIERFLRLNCLTAPYADIWEQVMGTPWSPDVALRRAEERRGALVEIDALTALALGISADELATIYRTGFGVLYHRYEKVDRYDAQGRLVPADIVKADAAAPGRLDEEARTWTHPQSGRTYTFAYPFRGLDREADMRAAWQKFRDHL